MKGIERYMNPVRSHLEKVITSGTDGYGPAHTAMWMASLHTTTGRHPGGPFRPAAGQRVYRDISAPMGSSIYWDQPELVAAYAVSAATGDGRYATAADAYADAFLERCIGPDGLFEWGNHRYYNCYTDQVVHFSGGPHEMRPIPGAWGVFWRRSPAVVERAIRQMAGAHVFDEKTGGFNRHDHHKKGCAFLESGGILCEALTWLYAKKVDAALREAALRIARFSFDHRDAATGLVENNPTVTRWDKYVCTTEVGLWAGSLARAADEASCPELLQMAADATAAFLKYGYEPKTGQYYGQVRVMDGSPVLGEGGRPSEYEYQPGNYADIWNAMFPTHDYPVALAQTCVELVRRTGQGLFREAVGRWADVIEKQPVPQTAKNGRGAYAECFGRQIHFLLSAAEATGEARYAAMAQQRADKALDLLFAHGMFRGHAGEDRYDAVDGVGYLLLALIWLATGRRTDYMGFGF